MRLEGAELLLWCNAGLGDASLGTNHRLNHAGAHAEANCMWVVCCNCVAPDAFGMSNIVGPNGEHLVILPPDQEGFAVATIDLAHTANWHIWRRRLGPEWKELMKEGDWQLDAAPGLGGAAFPSRTFPGIADSLPAIIASQCTVPRTVHR